MSKDHKRILNMFDKALYFVGAIILIVLNLIIISYLIVNIANIKTEVLNMNPPEKVTLKHMAIYYPPPKLDAPSIQFDDNFTMHGVSFSVDVYLSYNGTLAEGIPVNLASIGALYPDGQQTVDYVTIGFEGATYYKASGNAPPQVRPSLNNSNALVEYVDAPVLGTISWNTQGNHYPYVVILFKNGSEPLMVNYRDDNHRIYVDSYSVIQNQNNDRVITSVEIAGVFFVIEGGLAFMVRILRKKPTTEDNNNGDEHAINEHKTKTNNKKPRKNKVRKPRK